LKKNYFPYKFLFLFLLLVSAIGLKANTYYWVGNGGLWNDASHWSRGSGGNGGVGVPGINDNVVFDRSSFTFPNEAVTINGTVTCKNIEFTDDVYYPVIKGNLSSSLEIYGNVDMVPDVSWQFNGAIHFKSSQANNLINFGAKTLNGEVFFDGSGSWKLNGYLMLGNTTTLNLVSGSLHAAGNVITCGTLRMQGGQSKVLDINNSILFIKQQIDSSSSSNFSLQSFHSLIYYKNQRNVGSFAGINNNVHPPLITSWDTTVIRPSCNCNDTSGSVGLAKCCNGKVVIKNVVSSNGGQPFKYTWSTGATIDSVTGVCASLGAINCTIIDTSDLSSQTVIINVSVPQLIIPIETTKPARCNGQCNGWIVADISGGTPNYSYQWNLGLPGNGTVGPNVKFIDSALCVVGLATTYTLTVTDAHSCRHKYNYGVTQPKAIIVTLQYTNVQCNGLCNGTASVTSTIGGHGIPYTYKWAPGGQTTTTITGLCPGTYTVTAKDDSNCTGTASVTITQPNPIVMNPTQTNVSCFGACDGSATVNPTGGTPPYTYKWTPNVSTSNTASPLCAGNYKVVLTDAQGCKDSASFVITQPALLKANLTQTNVDCNGNCNGTAKVIPTGGTVPYTYLWSTGATTTNVSGLCASPPTYWVKVTDAHGCIDSISFTITQPPAIVMNPVAYNVACNGFCTGSAVVHPTGGTPPYTYAWSPPVNSTDSVSRLCAGVYKVVVTDAHGCKDSVNITITQPPAIQINITSTNVSCHGNCDGSATANVSGGTPGYNYLWSNGKTTSTIVNLCAASYTVTVTDSHGCTATASVIITQPNSLTVTLSAIPNPVKCFHDSTSTITSTVSGGTAPYGYLWSPGGQNTPSITNQPAGTYKLMVTDAHGCKDSASIIISQPTQLRDSIKSITNIKCNGGTGSATVGVKGGTPGYTFSWAPSGGTNATASNLSAGTYTVTVTDNHGCSVTASATITQPTPILLSASSTGEKCNGNINGTATVNASGGTPGYTYSWAPGGKTTQTITGLSVGCYTVTVTDANGCNATASTCVTEPAPLSAIISATTSSCSICDGSAKVTVSGGTLPYTYAWTTIPVQTTDSATGLCVGNYTVTVTDANGCTATAKATIVPTVQIIVTTSSNSVSCFGECDGIATANPSGGTAPYTYSWTTAPVQTNQTATGLCAGSYTVTVKDANGCTTVDSVKFTNPPQLTVLTSHTNVSCVGKCDGTASATAGGGTPPYTYQWSNGATTSNISNLCIGNDTIIVTDANGCTVSAFVTITAGGSINDNPTTTPPTCGSSNGTITLSPTGGTAPYTYSWAPPVSTGNSATGLSAGTYTVNISDASGCSQQFFVLLNNINGPTLSATSTGTSCSLTCDGTATVNVTAGVAPFTYLWSNGATTSNITGLCAGAYACSVKDANGCITNISDTVKKPVPINPNPTVKDIPCNGANNGSITLNTTGGTPAYTYSWSNGNTTSSDNSLSAGLYTITVKDNLGCDTVLNITITEPAALVVTINSTNITCNGAANGSATAIVSGGTVPYIYSWSNGGVVPTIVNLTAGSYTVTVTDLNGCTGTASVIITQPQPLTAVINPINVSCNLGSDGGANAVTSGGTPGYTFAWSNGQTTSNLQNVSIGTYYLTITDANGCTFNDSVKITQPPPIIITFTNQNVLCNGDCNGTSKAIVSGGTAPYTYSWNTLPAQTNQTATGLCAASYIVTVTDAHGCTTNNTVTITEPAALAANASSTSTTCPTACNGTATAAPSGGTAPYTYKWLPGGQITSSISNLCGGTDTLILTDRNGCVDSVFVTIPIPIKLSIVASTSPSNCNASNGSITVTPAGGSPAYTYLWSPGGQTTATITGLSAGIYTVQVTDSKGCDSTFNVLLNNSSGVSSFTDTKQNELCFGDAIGWIDVVPIGGTLPYVYFWANLPPPNGQGTDSIFNLVAGTYTLEVTDNTGCIQFDSVSVTQPLPIKCIGTINNANCAGVCTGSITLAVSGGTPAYTFAWSNGATTQNINNLCPGNDTVNITDADGCTLQKIFTVGQNVVITDVGSSTPVACNGGNDGTANAIPSGGGGTYTYSWAPGGKTSQTITGLTAGSYTVTITDQNGCQDIDTIVVTQPAPLVITMKNKPITCNNACDAQSIAQISGGTAPYTNHWSIGSRADTISNLCPGTYVDTVKDAHGCIAIDSAKFTNPPVMTENHILTNSTCNTTPDGDITITVAGGVPPYTFQWSNGATTQNLVNVLSGKYVLTLRDSTGCVIIDSMLLQSDTTVIANAGNDTTFCAMAATITLNGTKSINAVTYHWLSFPAKTLLGTTPIITLPTPPVGITSYLLVATDGGCSDTDTIVVTISPPPLADAGPSKTIVVSGSTTIGGSPTGPAGSTYHWSPPSGLGADTNIANPVASPTTTTVYTVTVVSPGGCIATDTVTVFVIPQLVIPDGFTPNGDGQNDVWTIKNIYLFPNVVVEIYNRWGEELFQSNGYKTPWDGTYNNEALPVGTYYYIIDLHDPRFPKAYTGPVTIMR